MALGYITVLSLYCIIVFMLLRGDLVSNLRAVQLTAEVPGNDSHQFLLPDDIEWLERHSLGTWKYVKPVDIEVMKKEVESLAKALGRGVFYDDQYYYK